MTLRKSHTYSHYSARAGKLPVKGERPSPPSSPPQKSEDTEQVSPGVQKQARRQFKREWHRTLAERAAAGETSSTLSTVLDAQTIRDIAIVPPHSHFKWLDLKRIDWDRRLACKADPVLDLKTYHPAIFYSEWADFHIELIQEIERCINGGGKKAIALPRASGKTAICRGMITRAVKYGLRKFCFFIGSTDDMAGKTLKVIKTYFHRNQLLNQDFPEICYPIYRCEGRSSTGSIGQLYRGERTYLAWSTSEFQSPCMLFTEEDIAPYLKHDPSCVIYVPEYDRFLINSAGCIIRVSGIDGSIRGEADIHPLLQTQPRPDLVLLDDVQKDRIANSPKSCEDLERLIETAIDYLAAPDVNPAILFPGTVIREGDVTDTYLNPDIKPDWNGIRYGLVKKFPPCMDYEKIYDEIDGKPNEQGKCWLEHKEIREQSLRKFGDIRLATQHYIANRDLLEQDFEASWPARFKGSSDPNKAEISAIQSLMYWRFKDHLSYLSEGENRPRLSISEGSITLTVEQVKERIGIVPRAIVSPAWINLVCFIDVQDEYLPWYIFAHDMDFNGQFIDYGCYPRITANIYRKWQANGWGLLSRDYYNKNPDIIKPSHINRDRGVKSYQKAPFDAKIYHGLTHLVKYLLAREFPVQGMIESSDPEVRKIRALAIDTKWGNASDVIKQFVRELRDPRVMCYEGGGFPPSNRQLEEFDHDREGWLFEQQIHKQLQESRWCVKPYTKDPRDRYVLCDVNRFKTFLMKRLSTPKGLSGAITIYEDLPERHTQFAMHICSEYPEKIQAGSRSKDMWKVKEGFQADNEGLDGAVGCMALASICGASLKEAGTDKAMSRKGQNKAGTMRQRFEQRKQHRKRA